MSIAASGGLIGLSSSWDGDSPATSAPRCDR
jgi:hypothetical protein